MSMRDQNKLNRNDGQLNVLSDDQSQFEVKLHKNNDLTKCMRQRKRKNKLPNNKFNWTLHQNLIYAKFLKQKGFLFNSQVKQRKTLKVNVLISKAVKTRTPTQCRSHHQKMLLQHQSIERIIQHFEGQRIQIKKIEVSKENTEAQSTIFQGEDIQLKPLFQLESYMKTYCNFRQIQMEEIIQSAEPIHTMSSMWWDKFDLQ